MYLDVLVRVYRIRSIITLSTVYMYELKWIPLHWGCV